MKRRPTEPRMRTVVRLLALLCKRIDRLEEQLRAIEMLIIYGRRTCPNAPMIDGYCVSKCDSSITFSTRAPFLRFAALRSSFPGFNVYQAIFPLELAAAGALHTKIVSVMSLNKCDGYTIALFSRPKGKFRSILH